MLVPGETVGTDVDTVAVVDVAIREHIPRTVFVVRVQRSSPVGIVDTNNVAVVIVVDVTGRADTTNITVPNRDRRDNTPVGNVADIVVDDVTIRPHVPRKVVVFHTRRRGCPCTAIFSAVGIK